MAKIPQRAFTGGELDPALHERVDVEQFAYGMSLCENFFVRPQGGVYNRAGTQYIGEVKDSTRAARIIPFSFNTEQTYVLEITPSSAPAAADGAIRVIRDGAYLLTGGTGPGRLEVAHDYQESELFSLQYVQTADTMSIAHSAHPPAELRRSSEYSWALSDINFGSDPSMVPAGVTLSAVGTGAGTDSKTYRYVITSTGEDGIESLSCAEAIITTPETSSTAAVEVTWNRIEGAAYYTVYRDTGQGNLVYGFIGYAKNEDSPSVAKPVFNDFNIAPMTSITPPIDHTPFTSPIADYPATVGLYQQRRIFANTPTAPNTFFASQTGIYNSMRRSSPLRDTDSLEFTIASRQLNEIRHIVDLESLILMTAGAMYPVSEGSDYVLTPSSIGARARTYVGASSVKPSVTIDSIIYVTEKGNRLRDMINNKDMPGDGGQDLSMLAYHLFEGLSIIEMVYAHEPWGILWCVMSNGELRGLTYNKEHGITAWHRHKTDGVVESITAVSEGTRDAVYFLVKRTINGTDVRYVERLAPRVDSSSTDAFFVDCGISYNGSPTTSITGLGHLEGKTVAVLADGQVIDGLSVSGGAVALPYLASVVHVGLPYNCTIGTLGITTGQPDDYNSKKNVSMLIISFLKSRGGFAGPSVDKLTEIRPRLETDGYGTIQLKTYEDRVAIEPEWNENGKVFFQQQDPLPCAILAITPEFDLSN